jgi:hypothetical protein
MDKQLSDPSRSEQASFQSAVGVGRVMRYSRVSDS